MIMDALESVIRYAKEKLMTEIMESEDKTEGIACRGLIPAYEQNKYHDAGGVDTDPETGYPYECMNAYDGTVQRDWTISNRTLWKPWNSRKPEYALRGKHRPERTICTRQESTWYGQTVTRTDASRIPF